VRKVNNVGLGLPMLHPVNTDEVRIEKGGSKTVLHFVLLAPHIVVSANHSRMLISADMFEIVN
jgi:hypothetical protein